MCGDNKLFFRVFQSREITVPSVSTFDPAVHLSWGDVAVNDKRNPTVVCFHLKRSKCDQFGRGVDVFIGRSENELCPVTAILSYIARRGDALGAFFHSKDGQPLTKANFITRVQGALQSAGVQFKDYTGHSFRIRAATAASQAGIPDSIIQMLGRWSSMAFLSYLRTPRDQLARVAGPLARVRTECLTSRLHSCIMAMPLFVSMVHDNMLYCGVLGGGVLVGGCLAGTFLPTDRLGRGWGPRVDPPLRGKLPLQVPLLLGRE